MTHTGFIRGSFVSLQSSAKEILQNIVKIIFLFAAKLWELWIKWQRK